LFISLVANSKPSLHHLPLSGTELPRAAFVPAKVASRDLFVAGENPSGVCAHDWSVLHITDKAAAIAKRENFIMIYRLMTMERVLLLATKIASLYIAHHFIYTMTSRR
jgi:hypothetical protein